MNDVNKQEPSQLEAQAGSFQLDPNNANRGTARGRKAITHFLQEYGFGRSILLDNQGRVVAGNKTLETA